MDVETINLALQLLQRVELKGTEVDAYLKVRTELVKLGKSITESEAQDAEL